ncbi:hypothetical protein [Buchnera aphidicola]|uniref:hypothetical protein n=1 Tax=Buchnera aphidicola TaxID=9 RepID=UPI00094D53C5|nr:hypothetical protein [Buchnera aphidicola]
MKNKCKTLNIISPISGKISILTSQKINQNALKKIYSQKMSVQQTGKIIISPCHGIININDINNKYQILIKITKEIKISITLEISNNIPKEKISQMILYKQYIYSNELIMINKSLIHHWIKSMIITIHYSEKIKKIRLYSGMIKAGKTRIMKIENLY